MKTGSKQFKSNLSYLWIYESKNSAADLPAISALEKMQRDQQNSRSAGAKEWDPEHSSTKKSGAWSCFIKPLRLQTGTVLSTFTIWWSYIISKCNKIDSWGFKLISNSKQWLSKDPSDELLTYERLSLECNWETVGWGMARFPFLPLYKHRFWDGVWWGEKGRINVWLKGASAAIFPGALTRSTWGLLLKKAWVGGVEVHCVLPTAAGN